MNTFALLDIFLRGGVTIALLVTGLVFVRRLGLGRKSMSVAALSASLIAYMLVSTPNLLFAQSPAALPLQMLAGIGPVTVYWAGVELFMDRPRFHWWHYLAAALIILGAWFHWLVPWLGSLRGVLAVLVYLHLLYVVIRTMPGDLVESRRQFRWKFLVAMAALGCGIGLVELLRLDQDLPAVVFPIHAGIFLFLACIFQSWAFEVRGDIWTPVAVKPMPSPELSPADSAVLKRLRQAMEQGVWRTEGLTIGQLADQLDTPEHRLRRVINRGLGHRNFAAFINGHRIEQAKTVLSDPAQADTPVLTIAHDAGFNSLGPFNRAFRDIMGESPTAFRQRETGKAGQS